MKYIFNKVSLLAVTVEAVLRGENNDEELFNKCRLLCYFEALNQCLTFQTTSESLSYK